MKYFVYLFIFISTSTNILAQSEITRTEPPNWWIGMEYNTIEILLYGKNISQLTPFIEYKGVKLISHQSYQNPNYLFVTIEISEKTIPGTLKINLSDFNNTSINCEFEIKERENGRKNIKGFDTSDAIYLITPDRFANGDPTNDNVPNMIEKVNRKDKDGRHGGDIQGIVDHLDYIKEMGFTSIWINPLLENNMKVTSYHGYSITDFYNIDPRFGNNAQYKKLCDIAKSKDLKIIMDMVANHCGSNHWWMHDLPTPNWINEWTNYTGSNHKKATLVDPYGADSDKKIFTDGWFDISMPDLNQRNKVLAKYLIQNTLWWIEFSGISGIRMDTYPYPDMEFMTDWTTFIMREYPNFNIVGEEWSLLPTAVSYWQAGKKNENGYTSALKSLMDFPLQNAVSRALRENLTWFSTWEYVYDALAQDYLYPDPMNLVIFPDNHDMSRIHAQLGNDISKTKMAMAYFATTRGIPQFYYGTEILMSDKTGDHGEIRSDFPGGWLNDTMSAHKNIGLSKDQEDFKNYLSNLLNWRKSSTVIHSGKTIHFVPEKNDVYVYFRYDKKNAVLVILNKNENNVSLDLTRFSDQIKDYSIGTEIISGSKMKLGKSLLVPAKTAFILELN